MLSCTEKWNEGVPALNQTIHVIKWFGAQNVIFFNGQDQICNSHHGTLPGFTGNNDIDTKSTGWQPR